jgi:hypothetical protein
MTREGSTEGLAGGGSAGGGFFVDDNAKDFFVDPQFFFFAYGFAIFRFDDVGFAAATEDRCCFVEDIADFFFPSGTAVEIGDDFNFLFADGRRVLVDGVTFFAAFFCFLV